MKYGLLRRVMQVRRKCDGTFIVGCFLLQSTASITIASAGSMTPKGLIAIGLTWFVAVVLWTCFFDRSVSHVWMAPGVFKKAVLVASFYLLAFLYGIFLVGWLAPLGLGIYRLVRHR